MRVGGISTAAEGFPGEKSRLRGSPEENFQARSRDLGESNRELPGRK